MLLSLVFSTLTPTDTLYVRWTAAMPMVNMAGTCRKPVAVASAGDSLWYRWRVFGFWREQPSYRDDSLRVSRSDTVTVIMPVPEVKYWVRYAWASRDGMSSGPRQVHGCARGKLLVPVRVQP